MTDLKKQPGDQFEDSNDVNDTENDKGISADEINDRTHESEEPFADSNDSNESEYNEETSGDEGNAHDQPREAQISGDSKPKRSGAGGWIASAILLVALIAVSIKAFSGGTGSNEAVATVNGVDISEHQLYETLVKGGNGASALENLITYELVNQEAQKQGVTISDADIDTELAQLKKSMGSEEAFNQALTQYNMTIEDLHADLQQQAQLRKLLGSKVSITDEDISSYYEQNKASFATEEQVRASHILVKTKEEADAIVKQLKEGADFATVAKEKSLDTGSATNGGDLDYFGKGVMDPAFEQSAFSLKVGEISEPVKSSFGYHIIKVADHKQASNPTLEDKKAEIKDTLTSQKIYELSQTLITDLRSQAKIENLLTKDKEGEDAAQTESGAAVTE